MVDLIRDEQDVWTLTYQVATDLAAQNVRYAELTVSPYSHITRGIPAEAVCEAIEDARRRAESRARPHPALVLRHPGGVRAPGRRPDPGRRAAPARRTAS